MNDDIIDDIVSASPPSRASPSNEISCIAPQANANNSNNVQMRKLIKIVITPEIVMNNHITPNTDQIPPSDINVMNKTMSSRERQKDDETEERKEEEDEADGRSLEFCLQFKLYDID